MSDQNKLDFPDWLKVRDVVEAALIEAEDFPASKIAEELMVADLIDIAAILGKPVVEELLGNEATEWVPTHEWRESDETTTGRQPVKLVQLERRIGALSALVRTESGEIHKAMIGDLNEIQS